MQSISSTRLTRFLTTLIPLAILMGCGEGEGKPSIAGTPAPPPPPPPPAVCNDFIGFEDACPPVTFTEFEGGVAFVVDNPDATGINTSAKVAQMQKFSATSGATFGGTTATLPTALNVTAGSSFTMKVWSQRAVQVLFQPEPQGPGSGIEVTHGGTGWEELTFSLPAISGTVSGITIIFDNGTLGDAAGDALNWTFYVDEITLVPPGTGGGGGGTFSTITFDDPAVTYTLTGFGGAEDSSVQADPAGGSNQVVQVNRAAGAEVFAGTTVSTGANASVPTIPLDAANTEMTVRVYSPAAGVPVRLKIESASDPAISVETEATTITGGAWETLTFDFSNEVSGTAAFNPAATYNKVTIFFNFGAAGAPAETYFFDDIDVGSGGGGGGGSFAAITFDDAGTTYTLTGFGGAEDSTVVGDPTGGSNQVVQVNRAAGAEVFAGTTVSTGANASIPTIPLDAANTEMTVRVYSPAAGVPVRLKIENASDPAISVETEATTTAANTWETLTFDFSNEVSGTAAFNPAATYNKVTIFFNFGAAGAPAETYFFDDIDVGSGGGGGAAQVDLPVTFEDAGVDYELQDFGGVTTTLVADPTGGGGGGGNGTFANGNFETGDFTGWTLFQDPPGGGGSIAIDTSGQGGRAGAVARLTAAGSDVVGTNDVIIGQVALAAGTIAPGDVIDVSFDLFGSLTGAGGVVFVEVIFLDAAGSDNGRDFVGPAAPYTPTGSWTTHMGAVTAGTTVGGGSASVAGGVTLELKAACGAIVGGCGVDASFDNVTFTINGGAGGSGAPKNALPMMSAPGGTVASTNKPPGAEVWGGTTVANVSGFATAIPFSATDTSMTVQVYSPDAGIPVRLKVEDTADGAISVETEAMTTMADTWETLTFDFSNEAAGTAALDLAATYDKASIFFNFGTDGNTAGDKTYLWDEITFVTGGGGGGGSAPVLTDFEGAGPFNFTDFDGGVATVIANPDASGINTSATVGQMQKFAGQPWGGSTLDLGGAVDWSGGEVYTMKVRSPRIVDVLFKLEGLNQERTATHGGTGWELLCFDFTGTTGGAPATAITLIFDNGVMGDAANDPANWTFEFDDIEQVASCPGGGGGGAFAPITFDDAAVTYTLTDFGGNASVVTNDPAGGTNMVAQSIKSDTAELWAGTTVSTEANDAIPTIPLDAANTQMTVRVYSPDAGIPVRLKIENASDPTLTAETEAMTTGVNTWETLTFDFANPAAGTAAFNPATTYNKVSIFFNFGTTGAMAGEKTYFFDDIDVGAGGGGGGGGGSAPTLTDFEGGPYTFNDFDGGAATVIANPDVSGINTSAMVAQMQKFAGQPWGGSTLDLGGAVDWSAGEVYTMKVRSPRVVPVLFKLEGLNQERSVDHGGSGTWEELCFDFTGTTAGAPATAITFIFDLGVMGDAAGDPANWTFEFDDIEQVASCPGGGGGGGAFAPITFDDAAVTYTLTGFGGAEDSTVVVDPAGGANMVARIVKNNTAQLWAGTTVSTEANEAIPTIPLDAANTQMTVRVYSPDAGIPVRLKIENASDPTLTVETEAMTTGVNTWETLTFDFANQAAGTAAFNPATTYNKISIFFNFGTDGATAGEKIYHFDDIDVGTGGGGGGGGGGSAPISTDFEGAGPFNFSDFDGGVATVIANPDASGINTSATVGQMQKFAGQPWGGSTLDLGGAVDWSGGEVYTMKVRSPRVVDVLLKLEGLNQERTATHGGTGWELLCFDFTGTTGGAPATAITLIFDNGVMGDAANDPANWTFEFDDIEQVASCPGGGGGGAFAPITFDDAAVTYTLTDFGGNASVVTNDPAGGTNMVAQAIKSNTAELWAGTTVSTEANDAIPTIPLDAANTQMTVRVYSPDAGIPVRLKIENASDPTLTVETEAMTTGVNTWETLTFDFANPAAGTAAFNPATTYNKVSIFFNFGTTGATAGEKTYYFDDIDVGAGGGGGGGGGSAPTLTDFEGGPYTFNDFDGGAATVIANPDVSGINTSAMVAQMQKFAGQPWGGSTLDLGGAVDWSAGEVYTMKVRSPRVVPVLFKLEGLNQERSVDHVGSGTWEELCFDFTGATAGAAATAITFIFDLGVMGDAAGDPANWTFEFDDIEQVASCPGGGGGGGSFAPITFDDAAITYTLTGFGGAEGSTVTNDPAGGTNMVAQVIKSATAELWAGTTVSTEANQAIPTIPLDAANTQMTVRVYSPDAGIPVRLKIEDASDPTLTVETEAMTTGVNTWETLTFDFANEAAGTAAFNPATTYNKVSIFFNFGTTGATAGEKTYYFDDIAKP